MKKFFMLCGGLFLPSYLLAAESKGGANGIFVGLDTGYSVSFIDTTSNQNQNVTQDTSTNAPALIHIGVRAGYNFYFTSFIGLRGYIDYSYGFNFTNNKQVEQNTTTTTSTLTQVHNITANVDVLFNFYNSDFLTFGAFVGIGLGYGALEAKNNTGSTITTSQKADAFILPINLGLSLIAGSKHRFDLGFKIPIFGLKDKSVSGVGGQQAQTDEVTTRFLTTSVGYSYTF